jgi:hypothetical protein
MMRHPLDRLLSCFDYFLQDQKDLPAGERLKQGKRRLFTSLEWKEQLSIIARCGANLSITYLIRYVTAAKYRGDT